MLAEGPLPGTSTKTTGRSFMQQPFEALQDGDHFWCERHLNTTDLDWVNR